MANNYSQGCTLLSASAVPARAKILKSWKILSKRNSFEDCYPFHLEEWGGLDIEASDDGGLYISSGEEWFNDSLFFAFVGLMLKNGWIDADSVTVSCAFFCDKLRADSFGGYISRVNRSGETFQVGTATLEGMTDDGLKALAP